MVTVGSSRYTYEVIENWGALPEGWTIGEVATVAVDSQDRLYAHQRKEPPILDFRPRGQLPELLGQWGSGNGPRHLHRAGRHCHISRMWVTT